MSDWISREDALEILEDEGWVGDSLRRIHALPAVQPDARIKQYEESYQYALHLAEALRENYPPNPDFRFLGDLAGLLTQIDNMVAGLSQTAVQLTHVNETPKIEHDARDMLTLTAERDRFAAAVDAVMADRKRIIEERDRSFVMVMERAEKAEAEVARLTALLPHPGETDDEVMWRSFQRGVSLAELAKAAGITKERARLKLRKAEMRMGGA